MTYDVMRRYFEWRGLAVHHVANVTDIDDQIIARAQAEDTTEPAIAAVWKQVYDEVMDALGILRPHDRPHATEYVEEMVDFIQTLIDNGSAYANDSGVYLRVHTVEGYGELIHRSLDDLREGAGARVEVDDNKEDPLDFALWKAAKPGEPTWPSPWGDGRPGWHIECVAMSLGILGDGFDLHGGGTDLVFPHHTNERAEAIAAGRDFAQHWAHNAMLNISGEKMSKSLGNFTTIQTLLDEHPDNGRALRLALLQTHYRKVMELNPDVMAQSREGLKRLDAMVRKASGADVPLDGAERDAAAIAAFTAAWTTTSEPPKVSPRCSRRSVAPTQRSTPATMLRRCWWQPRSTLPERWGSVSSPTGSAPGVTAAIPRSTRWSRPAPKPGPARTSPRRTGFATNSRPAASWSRTRPTVRSGTGAEEISWPHQSRDDGVRIRRMPGRNGPVGWSAATSPRRRRATSWNCGNAKPLTQKPSTASLAGLPASG